MTIKNKATSWLVQTKPRRLRKKYKRLKYKIERRKIKREIREKNI